MPGYFDITRDMCELMAGDLSHNFLVHFVETVDKGTMDLVKPFFHSCPYTVGVNYVFKSLVFILQISQGFIKYENVYGDLEIGLKIMETGEYQTDITFFSSDNVRYFNLKTFFKINCLVNK
jgi:hypothetical protein